MKIQQELQELAEAAGFTHQDMATWLQCHYCTTDNWFRGIFEPSKPKQQHVADRLKLLRRTIRQSRAGLPIPVTVTQYERKAYVEGVRDRALKGIFSAGTST